jgi:hypothetical protein
MNPLLLLALAGGGYVLYQQSQGKSVFGGEECPSKIEIDGAAFAREILPGYENGGVVTQALNDAGIVVGAGGSFSFEDKKAGVKKFVSANYTKKLADKIFKKLVPSGCKKSDKGTVVCMAIASVPNTDKVAMIEMHLPSFWILIHSTLIATFAGFFMTLSQLGEEGMEEKAAKCQTLIGKELEWWRKTMGIEGDIPDDVVVKEVPKGDHKPAELPSHLIEGLLEGSGASAGNGSIPRGSEPADGGYPGKYGPSGRMGSYALSNRVEKQLIEASANAEAFVQQVPAELRSGFLDSPTKMAELTRGMYDSLIQAYTDPEIKQVIQQIPPVSDTQTKFEMEGPGATLVHTSPGGFYMAAYLNLLAYLLDVDGPMSIPQPVLQIAKLEAEKIFGPGLRNARLSGDLLVRDIIMIGRPANA